MAGARRLQLAGLALLGGAAALHMQDQQVLAQQAPLIADDTPVASTSPSTSSSKRPLVETEALQDTITSDNLLARAKELYEIAKLGEEEFNHPTRVIGSDGTPYLRGPTFHSSLAHDIQVTSERWTTSTSTSRSWATTTRSGTRPSPPSRAMSSSPALSSVTRSPSLRRPWP